ncbi:MAG: cytochrome b/b6 domain-containing protein [Coriobacteriia bacterium]|nr:cytochrome b/b6 domain-containing protein [Coriobacteriia bacterium]
MAHLAHYRQSHPLPYVITHWINLISIVVLIISGIYIHFPFMPGFMGVARGAHIFFAFTMILNLIFRVISSFFVKSAPAGGTRMVTTDIKSFMPQVDNRHQLWPWIKYYLFLQKDHPLGAKYGVPQKITYVFIPILIICIAFTGFCMWAPSSTAPLLVAFTNGVGGIMVVRIIHFYLMCVFVIFMMIHVYLVFIEGTAPVKMMFIWKEHKGLVYDPKVHTIVGEDDMDESDQGGSKSTANAK